MAENNTPIPYAGFWVRFFAACIDLVCYIPFYYAVHDIVTRIQDWLFPLYLAGREMRGGGIHWEAELVFMVFGLTSYAWFFASKWRGSPGMKLLGIHIETEDAGRVSYLRALIWGITGTVGWLIAGAGVLYLQSHYDLAAINGCLNSSDAYLGEDGKVHCGGYEEYAFKGGSLMDFMYLSTAATLFCFLLLFVWAVSIGMAKDKAGFHNRICGTRMVRSSS